MNLQLFCLLFCALIILTTGQRVKRALKEYCYPGRLFYEEIGCTAVYRRGVFSYYSNCPMEYNCGAYTVLPDHCRYSNCQYAIGEPIRNSPRCMFCHCDKFNEANSPQIICAMPSCAAPPEYDYNVCYLGHNSLDSCCNFIAKCPPFNSSLNCNISGTEYKDGTIYQLPGTCTECLCKEGTSICQKIRCTFEFDHSESIRKKCAPVYSKDYLCCPATFACSEHIEIGKIKQCANKQDSGLYCHLENMRIRQNQKLHGSIYGQNITCTCNIPPFATCIFN